MWTPVALVVAYGPIRSTAAGSLIEDIAIIAAAGTAIAAALISGWRFGRRVNRVVDRGERLLDRAEELAELPARVDDHERRLSVLERGAELDAAERVAAHGVMVERNRRATD